MNYSQDLQLLRQVDPAQRHPTLVPEKDRGVYQPGSQALDQLRTHVAQYHKIEQEAAHGARTS